MEYRRLGWTDLRVSAICLGTMTWGRQNTEAEGHEQMDYAVDCGVTFFDTAELYAIPPTADTYGRTEEIIGTWFKRRGGRDKIVLASKVAGPSANLNWIREGKGRLDAPNIRAAVDASLRRLQTDYIDLYQLHWPDRKANYFGQLNYVHDPSDDQAVPIAETLQALDEIVRAGKVRYIGLSNETPWGVMTFLRLADQIGLPRAVSIQNPYNLLNRIFEIGLAEIAIREDCGLLAYSPLGGGTLSGKYLGGAVPPGSRRSIDYRGSRYSKVNAEEATAAYVELAHRHGLQPVQMALAFVTEQPFVTSNIIGATSMVQLRTDLEGAANPLSAGIKEEIEAIHRRYPNPCP